MTATTILIILGTACIVVPLLAGRFIAFGMGSDHE